MASGIIDIFCEDSGQESFAQALIERLADEARVHVQINILSARGGKGVVQASLRAYQRQLSSLGREVPDLLVALQDANDLGWQETFKRLNSALDRSIVPRGVAGCPDPHVERWLIADKAAFQDVVGMPVPVVPGRAGKGKFKAALKAAIRDAGHLALTDPMEFSADIVERMNLHLIEKEVRCLGHFISELRGALAGLAQDIQ